MLDVVTPSGRPFRPVRSLRGLPRACRTCSFGELAGSSGLGAFPWELRDRRALLRDNWQRLYNQIHGRSASPRKEFSPELVQELLAQHKRFTDWEDNLTLNRLLTEATGGYEPELVEFELHYKRIADQAAKELNALSTPEPAIFSTNPLKAPKIEPAGDNVIRNTALILGGAAGAFYLWRWLKR